MLYATDADEHHHNVPKLPPYSGQHWRPPARERGVLPRRLPRLRDLRHAPKPKRGVK